MYKRNTTSTGFTIVELLIVVVVIAILAAISLVAYSNFQQRAINAKTISSVAAYVRALKLYKAETDRYPNVTSCLGTGYQGNTCHTGSYLYTVNGGGLNTTYLAEYFGGEVPSPDVQRGRYQTTMHLAGAFYSFNDPAYGGTDNAGIGLYHRGNGNCPDIGGLAYRSSQAFEDGSGMWCRYGMN